jgi:hypothetical protein
VVIDAARDVVEADIPVDVALAEVEVELAEAELDVELLEDPLAMAAPIDMGVTVPFAVLAF